MSNILSEEVNFNILPVEIRAPGTVPTYPAYTPPDENIFPVHPGARFVNVVLNITSVASETYYVRLGMSMQENPSPPTSFTLLRADIYNTSPSIHYEQVPIEKRFVGFPSPGGTLVATFDLEKFAPKWCRVDVACSNAGTPPSISIEIKQGL